MLPPHAASCHRPMRHCSLQPAHQRCRLHLYGRTVCDHWAIRTRATKLRHTSRQSSPCETCFTAPCLSGGTWQRRTDAHVLPCFTASSLREARLCPPASRAGQPLPRILSQRNTRRTTSKYSAQHPLRRRRRRGSSRTRHMRCPGAPGPRAHGSSSAPHHPSTTPLLQGRHRQMLHVIGSL